MAKYNKPARQQGIALLIVLMLVAILSVVVSVYQYRNQSNVQLASQARYYLEARAAVVNAREQLIFTLMTTPLWIEQPNVQRLQELNLPLEFNFWGRPFRWQGVTFTIQDSGALVAVHPFEPGPWRALLKQAGVSEPQHLIDAIEDWYDTDDFVRLHGAEKDDYNTAGLPRNNLPQTIAELEQVKGMAPYWPRIAPYLTFLGTPVVNFEFAPAGLLPALLGEYRAAEFISIRNTGSQPDAGALFIQRAEDMGVYLSNRLRISIQYQHKEQQVAYRETIELLKATSTKRLSYIALKQPGYIQVAEGESN